VFVSLDIDMYKDGFTREMFDCVDIPMAAAAGYYDKNFYYYFGILSAVEKNWSKKETIPDQEFLDSFANRSDNVFRRLGLRLERHRASDKVEMIQKLKACMKRKKPVLVYTKYSSLFYNIYYKAEEGEQLHLLVIDAWNSENNTFRIRDSAFLRGTELLDNDADVLFPIRVTEDMLTTMWESNYTGKAEKYMKDCFDGFFTLESDENTHITFQQIISYFISDMMQYDSNFLKIMDNLQELSESISTFPEFYARQFIGNVKGLFLALEQCLDNQKNYIFQEDEYIALRNDYITSRENRFYRLYQKALTKRCFTQKEKEQYAQKEKENNLKLLDFLKKVNEYNQKYYNSLKTIEKVDLSKYFNNVGFALNNTDGDIADLTGNGIYFLDDDLLHKRLNSSELFQMARKAKTGDCDNISCQGQEIEIPKGKYTEFFMLACSEYGSYSEKIEFLMDDNVVSEVEISISDFYQFALYGEKQFWSGEAYQRKDGTTKQLHFNAKIFQYEYNLGGNEINKIRLCNRRNIHIFAITLIK